MRYGILFEVDILHDYLLNLGSAVHEALEEAPAAATRQGYAVPSFLGLRPTAPTRRRLAGQQLIFKPTGRGFRVGVRLDPAAAGDRPAVAQASDLRLVFALTVKDRAFANYTALGGSTPGFYYFSNSSGNNAAGGRFLTRPVPAFDTGRRYEAGEVRAEIAGSAIALHRAVRDTGPAATPVSADWQRIPPQTFDSATVYKIGAVVLSGNRLFRALAEGLGGDITDTAHWQPLGLLANQYVTAADRHRLRPSLFDLDLTAQAVPRATVRLTRPGAGTAAWERTYSAESGDLARIQLDLRRLDPGPYRQDVLDDSATKITALGADLYLDDQGVRRGWFGVIEIGPGAGELALLDGTGALRSPRYTLRFLNQATRWRYIFPQPQAPGAGAEVAQEGTDPRVLVTPAPRPLTRFGEGVRLQEDELVLLPEPGVRNIRRQDGQWFSEVHTSNLSI